MKDNEKKEKRTIVSLGRGKFLIMDSFQMWLAVKGKKTNDGDDSYRRITGYYTSYSSLLEGAVREGVLKYGGKTVEESLKNLAKIEKDIRAIAKSIGKELDDEHRNH